MLKVITETYTEFFVVFATGDGTVSHWCESFEASSSVAGCVFFSLNFFCFFSPFSFSLFIFRPCCLLLSSSVFVSVLPCCVTLSQSQFFFWRLCQGRQLSILLYAAWRLATTSAGHRRSVTRIATPLLTETLIPQNKVFWAQLTYRQGTILCSPPPSSCTGRSGRCLYRVRSSPRRGHSIHFQDT